MNEFDTKLAALLEKKQLEMAEFLNEHMSQSERNRIGEDICRIMPNIGDLAMIKIEIMQEKVRKNLEG